MIGGRYWPEWAPLQPVDAWTREGELNTQKETLVAEINAVQARIDALTGTAARANGGGGGDGSS